MPEARGIIPPILTPMREDESLNLKALEQEVRRMMDAGVHGVFCFGTNGEGYILSEDEKRAVLETVVGLAKGKLPVYAGTGCVSTRDTIRQSRMAQDIGADLLSIITPSFAAASQEELYTHYKAVAEAVSLPIILYNIPARTGNSLSPATVKRLAAIDNIIGVKDSSGSFDTMLQYIEQTREVKPFSVLSGNDSLILWNLYAGGAGGVSGCANVYPRTMVSIYEHFINGRLAEARESQDSIRSLRACFQHGNPNTIIKIAAGMLGHPVGDCRAPFNQLSQAGREALRAVLEENRARGMA